MCKFLSITAVLLESLSNGQMDIIFVAIIIGLIRLLYSSTANNCVFMSIPRFYSNKILYPYGEIISYDLISYIKRVLAIKKYFQIKIFNNRSRTLSVAGAYPTISSSSVFEEKKKKRNILSTKCPGTTFLFERSNR